MPYEIPNTRQYDDHIDRVVEEMFVDHEIGGRRKPLSLLKHLIKVQRSGRIPPRNDWRLEIIWFCCTFDKNDWPGENQCAWEAGLRAGLYGELERPPDGDRTSFQAGFEAGKLEAQNSHGDGWQNYHSGRNTTRDLRAILDKYFDILHPTTPFEIKLRHNAPAIGLRPLDAHGVKPMVPRDGESEIGTPLGFVASSRTVGPLGPASSVFIQRGLLSQVIGTVVRVVAQTITPRLDRMSDIEKYVTFVETDELLETCGRFNAQAFRGQLWGGTGNKLVHNILEKTERNRAHCEVNPYTILLIKAVPINDFKPLDQYIGFSHIIPLNEEGFVRYCRGEIQDNLLGPDVICAPGEKARALILFSIAVDASRSLRTAYKGLPNKLQTSGGWRYHIGLMLVRSLAYHIQRMMEFHDGGEEIELLAQNDGADDVFQALRMAEFQQTKNVSGDNCAIWSGTGRRDHRKRKA